MLQTHTWVLYYTMIRYWQMQLPKYVNEHFPIMLIGNKIAVSFILKSFFFCCLK